MTYIKQKIRQYPLTVICICIIWVLCFCNMPKTPLDNVRFIDKWVHIVMYAGTCGVMAAVGYFTKSDLTSMGKILFMALIGLVIATIVNLFLHSNGLDLIISYAGVLVFVGLTAYDSQKIKQMLAQCDEVNESTQKLAVLGSLTLYLDFINLFIYLLRIFGDRK